jgi:uncharacterized protein (DUF4415 family)
MQQDQDKIKFGNVELDEDEFAPKNQKHRVTTFIDGDVLAWLKERAKERNIGYQTLLNMQLREAMENHPRAVDDMKQALMELFEDGALVIKSRQGTTISKGARAKKAR